MKITFLGTGTSQGVPVIGCSHPVCLSENKKDKRQRSSILIEFEGKNIIIDCGPDFRRQMLNHNIKRLDYVLMTHEHADHTGGIDDLRAFNHIQKENIPMFGLKRVLESVKHRFHYAFDENRPKGLVSLDLCEVNFDKNFLLKNISIIPIQVLHGRLPILGFRVKEFAYLTDVKSIPDLEIEKLKGLDVLVISCLRKEKEHPTHLILEESLHYAKKINAKKTYFTHMSHLIGFHTEVEKELPENIYLAYDNLVLNV